MKNQYNIKVNPPELTSEQIKKHQDFDTLFAKFEQQASPADETPIRAIESTATKTSPAWLVKYGTSALIAIAASVVLVFMLKEVAFSIRNRTIKLAKFFLYRPHCHLLILPMET